MVTALFRIVRRLLPACLLALCLCVPAAADPKVRITGGKSLGASRIAALLAFPDPLPEWERSEWQSWSEDAALILREAYRDQGYLDAGAEVVPAFADTGALAPPAVVAVRIVAGPRYRFGRVEVRLPSVSYPAYRGPGLASRPGKGFNKNLLFSDRRELLKFYGNAGFLKVQAAESLFYDTGAKAVNVAFQVHPGPAQVFDTLLLRVHREDDTTGLPGKTRPSVLRGILPLRRGDTLSLSAINTFERKLKSTRAYNFVRVRDSITDSSSGAAPSALLLNAEEKIPGEMEAAAYWETQYGFGTDLSWSHGNLDGHLQEGSVGLTLAQRKQSVLLSYASPLLFGTSVRFDNDFLVDWYQDGSLVRDTGWFRGDFDVSNQSKLSRQLTDWARVVTGAELFGKSERTDSVSRTRDFTFNLLNSIYLQHLDDLVNPSRGARVAFTWGNGGPFVNDQRLAVFSNRHNWLEEEAAAFLSPPGNWVVLALRFDGGRFFGDGGINSERFFLGGPRSVRSEDWRRVCPEKNTDGNCITDGIEPAYFLGSVELRLSPFQPSWVPSSGPLRHLQGLQIVPFVDYGNVWEVGKNLTRTGEGRAVGAGLRYGFLSLFNIRVDYAQDPRDASIRRWIFDLAQAF